jgi:hypothetical protein
VSVQPGDGREITDVETPPIEPTADEPDEQARYDARVTTAWKS